MCMIDDAERVTMIGSSSPVAKTEHQCSECGRIIFAGEQYRRERFKFEGDITVSKTCQHCMVARDWLGKECGGWIYTKVEEDIASHLDEMVCTHSLKRLAAGMRGQWQFKTGKRMPIPRMPRCSDDFIEAKP